MKTEESFYIKVLVWAYENSTEGFSEQDLFKKFNIDSSPVQHRLYLKFFRDGNITSGNPPMIDQFDTRDGVSFFCLTEKGMSAAIDYLDLKQARESSSEAQRYATWSLGIAIVVGVVQIVLAGIQIWGCK